MLPTIQCIVERMENKTTFSQILNQIRDFINHQYLHDVLTITRYYKDYCTIGSGCGQFLSYGCFDLEDGNPDQVTRKRLMQQGLINTTLEIEGVLLTMHDKRTTLSFQVIENIKKHFKGNVYDTVIPRNVRLAEAPSFGKSIFDYDPNSSGAMAYEQLVKELLVSNSQRRYNYEKSTW